MRIAGPPDGRFASQATGVEDKVAAPGRPRIRKLPARHPGRGVAVNLPAGCVRGVPGLRCSAWRSILRLDGSGDPGPDKANSRGRIDVLSAVEIAASLVEAAMLGRSGALCGDGRQISDCRVPDERVATVRTQGWGIRRTGPSCIGVAFTSSARRS